MTISFSILNESFWKYLMHRFTIYATVPQNLVKDNEQPLGKSWDKMCLQTDGQSKNLLCLGINTRHYLYSSYTWTSFGVLLLWDHRLAWRCPWSHLTHTKRILELGPQPGTSSLEANHQGLQKTLCQAGQPIEQTNDSHQTDTAALCIKHWGYIKTSIEVSRTFNFYWIIKRELFITGSQCKTLPMRPLSCPNFHIS